MKESRIATTGGDFHDDRVVDLGQRQNAGVLTVGGVRRAADEAGKARGKTVADEGAVQAGVRQEVALAGRADRRDVADMLHHGGQRDRDHDQNGAYVKLRKGERRDTDKVRRRQGGEVNMPGDQRHKIGSDDTKQDRDDFDHAAAKDVCHKDHDDRDDCQQPVAARVVDRVRSEDQADEDDDRGR